MAFAVPFREDRRCNGDNGASHASSYDLEPSFIYFWATITVTRQPYSAGPGGGSYRKCDFSGVVGEADFRRSARDIDLTPQTSETALVSRPTGLTRSLFIARLDAG
jgi:hypothetical protein